MKNTIYIRSGKVSQEIELIRFPGGEVGVRIPNGGQYPEKVKEIEIVARLTNSDDVMTLLMVNDAVRREYPRAAISAYIPYIPYARQDRVCERGESLSIAVMAQVINSCEFVSVKVLDPHSDVTSALINYIEIVDQFDVFSKIYPSWSSIYIAAPDGGAAKKAENFAKRVGAAGVIHCTKIRDTHSGKITGTRVNDVVDGRDLLVLDDIGDGCGTFVPLFHSLKDQGAKSISLALTHGLFFKGHEVVTDLYHTVFATNSYNRNLRSEKNLIVLNHTHETY